MTVINQMSKDIESLTQQIHLEFYHVHQEIVLFTRANTIDKLSIHAWELVTQMSLQQDSRQRFRECDRVVCIAMNASQFILLSEKE